MPVGNRVLSMNPITVAVRELHRERRAQGLCTCGRNPAPNLRTRCQECRDQNVRSQRELRIKVIDAYGGKCTCCGETEFKFLSVDHIKGNGNQHRLSVAGHKKASILRWLVRNNFPKDFQILCHNCNMAKGCYGVCPHQENRQEG